MKSILQTMPLQLKPPPPDSIVNMIGRKFETLSVLSYAGFVRYKNQGQRRFFLNVLCDCGAKHITEANRLANGRIKSCGCFQRSVTKELFTKHGHVIRNVKSGTYSSWAAMIQRCTNKTNPHYASYRRNGTTVCNGWRKDFSSFLSDMGERPAGKTIDRKENKGHYSCGHCDECLRNNWPANGRWATYRQQGSNIAKNKWVTLNGERMIISEASRRLGWHPDVISRRLLLGWEEQRALTTPTKSFRKVL